MRHFLLESDLVLPKAITPLGYKQFDNGDLLEVEFWNDSERINLTTERVLAFFELTDGVVVQKTCTIKNGNAIATLDNNILAKQGQIKCEFTIYKGTTPGAEETTTKTIIIEVSKSIDRIGAITSVPHWDIVQEMLNKNDIIDAKIAELEAKKVETINTVTTLKNDTITTINNLKDTTTTDLNTIKTSTITALENIKASTTSEINAIKDTANADLARVKSETIAEVNRVAQEAIAAINNYNLKDISDKLNAHVDNAEIHVTQALKDQVNTNKSDIENLKNELKDTTLTPFTTSQVITPLTNCVGGMVSIDKIQGKTMYKRANGTVTDTWEIGVSLISSGERLNLVATNPVDVTNKQIVDVNFNNIYDLQIGDYIEWHLENGSIFKDNILIKNIIGNIATIDFGSVVSSGRILTSEYFVVKKPHKIEILSVSTGKNRFNKNSILIDKVPDDNTGEITSTTNNILSDFCLVEPNTSYKTINRQYASVWCYDEKRKFIGKASISGSTPNVPFTTLSNCKWVMLNLGDKTILNTIGSIMLIKSSESDVYESYKGDKTEILTTQPLRQWDSIDFNGVVNKGSTQIVLNGNEGWNMDNTGLPSGNSLLFYANMGNVLTVNNINIFSDKFKTKAVYGTDEEAIYNSSTYIWIRINKSKLTTQDVAGFKTWLSQNPATVVYQLATPVIENTNKTLALRGYDNLIINSGAIQPTVTYSYAKNVGERFVSIENTVEVVIDKVDGLSEYEEVILTPLNGFTQFSSFTNKAIRNGKLVKINISLDFTNVTFPFSSYMTIFSLPEKFKPSVDSYNLLVATQNGLSSFVDVNSSGNITIGNKGLTSKPNFILGTIMYML